MRRFYMGMLLGASGGFLLAALLEPVDTPGSILFVIGAALQGVYWFLKLRRRKELNESRTRSRET